MVVSKNTTLKNNFLTILFLSQKKPGLRDILFYLIILMENMDLYFCISAVKVDAEECQNLDHLLNNLLKNTKVLW